VLAAAAVIVGSVTVGAQESRNQRKSTVVIPQEVLMELQRIAREAFGEIQFGDLSRDLTRAMQDLSRELGHFAGPGFADGVIMQNRDFRAEQTDKQTKTLAIGASGSLELRNVVGDITVKAGSGREATVEIVRVSRGRTDADAKQGLARVTAEVSTRGDRGSVIAEYPDERRPNYAVSVAMTVTAPAGTQLNVISITGDVTVTGIKGETSINTTTGAIDVSQASALTAAHTATGKITIRDSQGDALDVGTMSGPVELSNVKARRLEVSGVTAMVSARNMQAREAEVTCMTGTIEYSGPVSAGGRYEFQSHNGEIHLALTGGFDFEGQTFNGQVEVDPAVGLKPQPNTERAGFGPRRQSVKGTVAGGGASVEATTFGGHVRLVKTLPEMPKGRGR